MIHGTGIDLVDIRRIAAALEQQGERFVQRILREEERAVMAGRGGLSDARAQRYLAGRFAAKEAFSKAWGTGIGAEVSFQDIAILNDERGAPVCHCFGVLAQRVKSQGLKAWVSLSDESDWVIAQVLLEKI